METAQLFLVLLFENGSENRPVILKLVKNSQIALVVMGKIRNFAAVNPKKTQ